MVPKSGNSSDQQQKVIALKPKEAVSPHSKMPHEDQDWVLAQSSIVIRLFVESWRSESFGKQWRPLKTKLRGQNLRKAIRVIEKAGLFKYQPVMGLTKNHRWEIVGWECQNLHGYYSNYWDKPAASLPNTENTVVDTNHTVVDTNHTVVDTNHTVVDTNHTVVGMIRIEEQPEMLSQQQFQICQPRLNHVPTTHQLPTKVVGGVVSIPSEETEAALGGQLPTSDGMPEEETPQGATDCASGSGAEKTRIESSASLPDQAKAAGGEPRDLGEDQRSAAAAAKVKIRRMFGLKELVPAVLAEPPKTAKSSLSPDQKAAFEEHQKRLAKRMLADPTPTLEVDPTPTLEVAPLRYTLCYCHSCKREWANCFPSTECDCGSRKIQHRDLAISP